jgi:hypothetical protein
MRKIPVFVSCPSDLSKLQNRQRDVLMKLLEEFQLEPRALGRGEYPKDYPLKEVYIIAKHCAGGLILGFEQVYVTEGIRKRGTAKHKSIDKKSPMVLPTPWNHLEAGILFGLKLPLLIFKEPGIEGGVFDHGITDAFVHNLPPPRASKEKIEELKNVLLKWLGEVSRKYNEY